MDIENLNDDVIEFPLDPEFAKEPDEEPEIEIDTGDTEPDADEDKGQAKQDDKKPVPAKDVKPIDNVTAKAVLKERERWQKKLDKMQTQLDDIAGNRSSKTVDDTPQTDEIYQQLIDDGYEEKFAKLMSGIVKSTTNKTVSTEKLVKKALRDTEYERLSANPHYSDITEYRDEIDEFCDKTGLSVKQSYHAIYGEEKFVNSRRDLETQIEQRVVNQFKERQGYKVDTTANGEVSTAPKFKLTRDELDVAKMAGMTPQEYFLAKKYHGTEHAGKYLTKKK